MSVRAFLYPTMMAKVAVEHLNISDPITKLAEASIAALGPIQGGSLEDSEWIGDVMFDALDPVTEEWDEDQPSRSAAFIGGQWREDQSTGSTLNALWRFTEQLSRMPKTGELVSEAGCFEDWFGSGTQRSDLDSAAMLDALISQARTVLETGDFVSPDTQPGKIAA